MPQITFITLSLLDLVSGDVAISLSVLLELFLRSPPIIMIYLVT